MNVAKERQFPESKLYTPVRDWLTQQGYIVFPECWGRDVVAYRGSHIITVELKMSMTRALYFQLIRAAVFSDAVFAAVPVRSRASTIEVYRQHKIGILRVGEAVEVVLPAPENREAWCKKQHDDALECLRGWDPPPEITVAGLPTLKGSGPAQQCANRVRDYLQQNPAAGWRDIYRNVPNHYAHHRSMRGAMPQIEYLRQMPPAPPSAAD
jgi:hypothetical protein